MIRKIHNISKSTQLNPSQHYIPNFILIKLSHKYFKAFVSPKILCLNRSLTPKIPKLQKMKQGKELTNNLYWKPQESAAINF